MTINLSSISAILLNSLLLQINQNVQILWTEYNIHILHYITLYCIVLYYIIYWHNIIYYIIKKNCKKHGFEILYMYVCVKQEGQNVLTF